MLCHCGSWISLRLVNDCCLKFQCCHFKLGLPHFFCCCCFLNIYLKVRNTEREEGTKQEPLSVVSLPIYLQWLWLDHTKTMRFIQLSHPGSYPRSLTESRIKSEAARTWTRPIWDASILDRDFTQYTKMLASPRITSFLNKHIVVLT